MAAIEQLLAEAGSAASVPEDDSWGDRRFAFAGRLRKLGMAPVRPRDGTPSDPWSAAGRAERL